jgi:hypothetical protein
VAPYVAITLDNVEMLRAVQEVTVKHAYILLMNTITFSIHVSCHFFTLITFLLNYCKCKKKSMNGRKLKCVVVCAEQLMQSSSESPKSVCVCVRASDKRSHAAQKDRRTRCSVSVTASIHSGRKSTVEY